MQLISEAMVIFSKSKFKGRKSVAYAINCYKEIYLKKRVVTNQQTFDNFVTKSARQPNQPPEIVIHIGSSISK